MRPASRRNPKESLIPTPRHDSQHRHPFPPSRDSDASFASSRPSSAGVIRPSVDQYKDRHSQQQVLSALNFFLASQNFPISFKTSTFPSAKDITETLKFLISVIDFPLPSSSKLEDHLPLLLKRLNYPFSINKSILRSPAAPHQWPSLLALLHWLLQIAKFNSHVQSSSSNTLDSIVHSNQFQQYTFNSYIQFIKGDDDAVQDLDLEINDKINQSKEHAQERLKGAQDKVHQLESELERLKSEPSEKEKLERQKGLLEEDVGKFHGMIEELVPHVEQRSRGVEEKEKQLEAKEVEWKRICEENEELRRKVESQTFNARDVERMKRELQAVERDIREEELARNAWEDKSWELDTSLAHKSKDLEALALGCNQELKRLKIGNGIQYQLNPKGTTPAEIMGIDHKLTLKPALNSFAEDIKKSSVGKLEELISYRQKSGENVAKLEGKRSHLAAVQAHIDEIDSQLNTRKKEAHDYTSQCSAEVEQMFEDVQLAERDLDIMEREAAEVLKVTELKLQETTKQSEEVIQIHARDYFKMLDSISRYKEHMDTTISEMKKGLAETAIAVSDAYKSAPPV